MRIGDTLYLRIGDEPSSRVLLRGVVTGLGQLSVSAIFDDQASRFETNREVLLLFELHGRFQQQSAKVAGDWTAAQKVEGGFGITLSFELIGEPNSGEGREAFRVCAWVSGIYVRIGGGEDCEVLDVSATGLALTATDRHAVGDVLRLEMDFQRETLAGRARVQSALDIGGPGKPLFRYGLQLCEDLPGDTLQSSMARVAMALQREQLARLAGKS